MGREQQTGGNGEKLPHYYCFMTLSLAYVCAANDSVNRRSLPSLYLAARLRINRIAPLHGTATTDRQACSTWQPSSKKPIEDIKPCLRPINTAAGETYPLIEMTSRGMKYRRGFGGYSLRFLLSASCWQSYRCFIASMPATKESCCGSVNK